MQRRKNRNSNSARDSRSRSLTSLECEANLRQVLVEVRQLLESYAPTWYTERLNKRIEAALRANADR